jgi:prevent-host-death family protein
MVTTLRESKAKLSELVGLASRGEEVLITVRGKVKARLIPAAMPRRLDDRAVWVASLRGLHRKYGVRKAKTRGEDILSELREDRF